ncbi:alkaline phosphatase D family protein [Rhodobacteraceae bacterium DSL-40]|uniref:alkaline phosphatase D family protein n=1 Tax=Amaricoccus sp. B4 TaxID=3368557 RepID=UPI000DAD11C5
MQEGQTDGGGRIGPILYLRGCDRERLRLAALVVTPEGEGTPPALETDAGPVSPERIWQCGGRDVLRYSFDLPATAGAAYRFDGESFEVAADLSGDLHIGFVSCNGQEHGDLSRPGDERNLMWRRLAERHRDRPLNLLLHGGDQLYADEVTEAHPLATGWPKAVPQNLREDTTAELSAALSEAFFERYTEQLAQPGFAWLAARVPSLAMWDDHDICDGWGSLKERKLDSPLGRALFAAARDHFLIFQFAAAPGEVPEICSDRSGQSLGWRVEIPGATLLAPDLRSERRPERVMGEAGWRAFRADLASVREGRVLLVSSVPALGPRLSIVERLMKLTPWMEKYEDDLRDQWQSRWHREEWRDFLRALVAVHERPGCRVSLLSGEIHLATRGTMKTAEGDIHQLVASGISHPAPPGAYATVLGVLARFGEAPLPRHPIRLHPLPGQGGVYAAERNFLRLERNADTWTAVWELEDSGPTAPMPL